jgi:hypothetical protein
MALSLVTLYHGSRRFRRLNWSSKIFLDGYISKGDRQHNSLTSPNHPRGALLRAQEGPETATAVAGHAENPWVRLQALNIAGKCVGRQSGTWWRARRCR